MKKVVRPVSNEGGVVIKVVGVGGAGGNIAASMMQSNTEGVEFVCINTDAQALAATEVPVQIRLGDHGRGAGGRPAEARAAADVARGYIRAALQDAQMIFIVAGMGGGTGTGAAPIVAEVASELGIFTVGVVTKPFTFEGERRMAIAEQGIAELSPHVQSLVVLANDRLMESMGEEATADDCFHAADDVLGKICGGLAEIINVPGLLNVDFEDVKTIMREPGHVRVATAQASGPARAREAAHQVLESSWLTGIDWAGARGVLVNISAKKSSLLMREIREIMDAIQRHATQDAHIIVGAVYDEALDDQLRVTLLATGLGDGSADGDAPAPASGDAA